MTVGVAWAIVALLIPPQIVMLMLQIAPKSFWRGLANAHRGTAHYLWGFSHMFGPLSRPGEEPAWEKLP